MQLAALRGRRSDLYQVPGFVVVRSLQLKSHTAEDTCIPGKLQSRCACLSLQTRDPCPRPTRNLPLKEEVDSQLEAHWHGDVSSEGVRNLQARCDSRTKTAGFPGQGAGTRELDSSSPPTREGGTRGFRALEVGLNDQISLMNAKRLKSVSVLTRHPQPGRTDLRKPFHSHVVTSSWLTPLRFCWAMRR